MMKQSKYPSVVLSTLIILMTLACEAQYSNPPQAFHDSDLVGIWEAHYMGWSEEWGSDKLILRADGTFKQIYQDHTVEDYIYETRWNEWWVERFPDGRGWVHLQGARFYGAGIRIAELEGMRGGSCPEDLPDCHWDTTPRFFYDPITGESVYMVGELVLNVQSDSSGGIVLLPMLLSKDEAWLSRTGEALVFFSRNEAESLQQKSPAP